METSLYREKWKVYRGKKKFVFLTVLCAGRKRNIIQGNKMSLFLVAHKRKNEEENMNQEKNTLPDPGA